MWDRFSLDAYLNRELRFWKSLKAAYVNEPAKRSSLNHLRERFGDQALVDQAEGRFKSMATLIGVFEKGVRDRITERVNEKLGANIPDVLDLAAIRKWQNEVRPGATLAYDWVVVAVIVVIVIIVIVAEANDNNGVQEDDTVVITVGTEAISRLVDENNYLQCADIEALNYSTWATYLLMVQAADPSGAEYLKGLVCAGCANLRTLVASFNYDHSLILPDQVTWLGVFLYAAKLEECKIPY